MSKNPWTTVVVLRLVLALFAFFPPVAIAAVDFATQIRPILSDRCFRCHGPDQGARKAGLRLDLSEESRSPARSGKRAIVPGRLEESELVRRIDSSDPDEHMPPVDSKLSLSKDEIALLRQWITEGGVYRVHWAFEPVRDPALPYVAEAQSPIDAFVVEALAREGLVPAAEADRATLIRRVTLDLTGLPPSVDEIDAFGADFSPDAYERVVDRLLASTAFGEREALEWIDLARYADTYGYQSDVERDLSAWRDWVIRAFNENMPFDQFVEWQLAGDLIPNASRDSILATAFNRLHRQTNEGGSIEEEFRTEYVADRVHTFGTALLGLTLECARCHDHKYDPIPQRDYYSLFAFFNQIDESGLYSHFTQATPTPTMVLYQGSQETQHRAALAKVAEAEAHLARVSIEARDRFGAWRAASRGGVDPPKPTDRFLFDAIAGGKSPNIAQPERSAQLQDAPDLVDGPPGHGKALRFSGDNAVVAPKVGAFARTDPFSIALWVRPAEKQARAVVLHCSRSWTDSGSRGYELVLDEGRPTFALIHFWPGNAIAVRGRNALPLGGWSHIVLTYDGSSRAAGLVIYVDGSPIAIDIVRDHLDRDIRHRAEWGDSDVGGIFLALAGRFRDSGLKGGAIDDVQVFDLALTPLEAAMVAEKPIAAESISDAALSRHFLERRDEPYAAARADLKREREAEDRIVAGVREIMVMKEIAGPRPTFLLRRGAYDLPTDRVEAGVPERIAPFSPRLPRNRLGLARWVLDPSNPLTARVAVNRMWKLHFGRGLVETVEDFGSQGRMPSHPELLDWLAARFVRSGWDRKLLRRLIVTSATYRQSSQATASLATLDPGNRLLARGPKHRLAAEAVRDQALAASGLLVRKLGGPSVKPYQPAGVWEEAGTGKVYTQDHGERLYRRSLYTFWRRTAPPPSMLSFDATTREVCTAKRETTATPLQSLVLLNDPQFIEAARALAESLLRLGTGPDRALREGFLRLLGREPLPRESETLRKLFEVERERYAAQPELAAKLLAIGEKVCDPAPAAADLAAATIVMSTIMNHDEFVMKR